ncbi:MAG: YopX family protein [Clostridiales bacterium]|nr:YopX family protein [Clostridiales bacterium]
MAEYTGLATNSFGESYTQSVLIEVDPETIGEYIKLKDKNKKKIFEGDILLTEATIEDYGDTQVQFPLIVCICKITLFPILFVIVKIKTINRHVLSAKRGYTPITSVSFGDSPFKCATICVLSNFL